MSVLIGKDKLTSFDWKKKFRDSYYSRIFEPKRSLYIQRWTKLTT